MFLVQNFFWITDLDVKFLFHVYIGKATLKFLSKMQKMLQKPKTILKTNWFRLKSCLTEVWNIDHRENNLHNCDWRKPILRTITNDPRMHHWSNKETRYAFSISPSVFRTSKLRKLIEQGLVNKTNLVRTNWPWKYLLESYMLQHDMMLAQCHKGQISKSITLYLFLYYLTNQDYQNSGN